MSNLELLSQVLFKKYEDQFQWLNYSDLKQIIKKFAKDPLFENSKLDIKKVCKVHNKIYPLIEKIQQVKSLRNLDEKNDEENEEESNIELKNEVIHSSIRKQINPKIDFKNYYVLIDSKDRNKDYWPANNPFQFDLQPSSIDMSSSNMNNSINRKFNDIHSITIKQIILPKIDITIPYILVNIQEIGSNINISNDMASNCFGYLTNPKIVDSYMYYSFEEYYDSHLTKIFEPRIELSKLTISFLKPDGKLIEFNNDLSVIIELMVTCLQKKLENTILYR
tara:strand:+ start:937 stop:1773 length:837 start_codon:yes stop_codon:yes gene_type:complete